MNAAVKTGQSRGPRLSQAGVQGVLRKVRANGPHLAMRPPDMGHPIGGGYGQMWATRPDGGFELCSNDPTSGFARCLGTDS